MRTHYIMLFFFFLSCSSKKEMYQFECSNLNSEGYVELKVSNLINPEKYPLQKAAKDAIKVILFTGYSSVNCQTQKPILTTLQEKENFNKIKASFFGKKQIWKNFVRNSFVNNKDKGFSIMVSKDKLRKYLEENNIIEKLNKGF